MTDQAGEILRVVRAALGDDLLGAYLHGSAVLGGMRPTSDLDVFVVVRRPTTADERQTIVRGLLEISGERARRGPDRPVELTIVVQDELRPWRYPPRQELLYGEWLRDAMEAGAIPGPHAAPDLATLVTMVLAADHPLLGPPPCEVLDPVPPADLRRAIHEGVPGLLADLPTDTRNVVLTLARTWVTLATGEILPKDEAADWALPRLPAEHRAVLEQARDAYLAGEEGSFDELAAEVGPHAAWVVGEIERLAAEGPSAAPRALAPPRQSGTVDR